MDKDNLQMQIHNQADSTAFPAHKTICLVKRKKKQSKQIIAYTSCSGNGGCSCIFLTLCIFFYLYSFRIAVGSPAYPITLEAENLYKITGFKNPVKC